VKACAKLECFPISTSTTVNLLIQRPILASLRAIPIVSPLILTIISQVVQSCCHQLIHLHFNSFSSDDVPAFSRNLIILSIPQDFVPYLLLQPHGHVAFQIQSRIKKLGIFTVADFIALNDLCCTLSGSSRNLLHLLPPFSILPYCCPVILLNTKITIPD